MVPGESPRSKQTSKKAKTDFHHPGKDGEVPGRDGEKEL